MEGIDLYEQSTEQDIQMVSFNDDLYEILAFRIDNNSGILMRNGLIYGMHIGFCRICRIPELDGKELSDMVQYLNDKQQ